MGQLRALRAARLTEDQVADFIHDAGEADFRIAESEVARFLSHTNRHFRYNAVSTLGHHWKERAYASMFARMMNEDPDEYVRIVAAGALGALFEGTGNRRFARLLARKVMDAQEDRFVREAAYESLLEILLEPSERRGRRLGTTEKRERAARQEINALLARGEDPKELLDQLDQEWEKALDWDLVNKAALMSEEAGS